MHIFVMIMLALNPTADALGPVPAHSAQLAPFGIAFPSRETCEKAAPLAVKAAQKMNPSLHFEAKCVDTTPYNQPDAQDMRYEPMALEEDVVPPKPDQVHAVMFAFTYDTASWVITSAQAIGGYKDYGDCTKSTSKVAALAVGKLRPGESLSLFCVARKRDGNEISL